VIVGALLVEAGAAVVTGLGGTKAPGLLLACGALAAEACFTLLAVPLLSAFGPLRLSAYVTGLSVPVLFGLGFATGGRGAVPVPTAGEAAAIAYLAGAVGAGGFYFLYSALPRLGAEGVGLFAGLVPFGAMGAAILLGAGTVRPADLGGALLVAAGVAAGTRTTRAEGGPDGARNGPDGARNARAGEGRCGGATAQPDADGGTACLANIARTGAPRGAAPPHSVTIQACRNMYKS
jgi:drug/metabolite transporter (DMT)-like permease